LEQSCNQPKNKLCTSELCEAGLVFRAEDYRYSSAVDYSDKKGLLDNILVLEYLINNIMRPHDAIVR